MWLLLACTAPSSAPETGSPDTSAPGCAWPDAEDKDFEDGTTDDWVAEAAEAWSVTVVDDIARCGSYAARFEIREGDSPTGDGFRAELHELADFAAPFGSEVWYAFSTLVPDDWVDLDNRAVIAQWHATPDLADGEAWRSPPLAVRYRSGEVYVTARHASEPVQPENDAPEQELWRSEGAWEKGVWHDWVFGVRWTYEDEGFVQVFHDGEQVVSYEGPIGYNDVAGPWFKWGIYRDDVPEVQVLFHDAYRRGDSYDAVAP